MSSHSGMWKKTVFTYGIILLGSGILSFGLYNIHERTNVTEGGVLGMTLLLQHWFGFSPWWYASAEPAAATMPWP